MYQTEDGSYIAHTTCPYCGSPNDVWSPTEDGARLIEEHPGACPLCEHVAAREQEEQARQAEITLAKQKAAEAAAERLAESQLNKYDLGFDVHKQEANRALAAWMLRQIDHSVWIYGETGLCKTRIVQMAARIAVQDRSVRYWPAYDLAARLTETSKHPESTLHDVYGADLLILDDLGLTNLTDSRLRSLVAIVDKRYIGWDQVRRAQGAEQPTFGWSSYGRRRQLGGQIWITSQVSPEDLARQLAAVNSADAAALVRRLADMCVVHQAEVIR